VISRIYKIKQYEIRVPEFWFFELYGERVLCCVELRKLINENSYSLRNMACAMYGFHGGTSLQIDEKPRSYL